MTLELLINPAEINEKDWLEFPEYKFRQFFFWKNTELGNSFALLEFEKGGGIPTRHLHASNQFMYCISGKYEYTSSNLILTAGSFYMNPKDNLHGPTIAHEKTVLIEVYDGPHYYEKPE